MSNEIKPALTAEEWAAIGAADTVTVLMDGGLFVGRGRTPGVPGEPGLHFDRYEISDRRAGLAAALLQRAGPDGGPMFTHEMVDALEECVWAADFPGHPGAGRGVIATLRSLLPPREP